MPPLLAGTNGQCFRLMH